MSTAGYETDESSLSWIEWHCELPQNRFLCEVDRTFIEDKFNLYGLKAVIKGYEDARLRILDLDDDSELDERLSTYPFSQLLLQALRFSSFSFPPSSLMRLFWYP